MAAHLSSRRPSLSNTSSQAHEPAAAPTDYMHSSTSHSTLQPSTSLARRGGELARGHHDQSHSGAGGPSSSSSTTTTATTSNKLTQDLTSTFSSTAIDLAQHPPPLRQRSRETSASGTQQQQRQPPLQQRALVPQASFIKSAAAAAPSPSAPPITRSISASSSTAFETTAAPHLPRATPSKLSSATPVRSASTQSRPGNGSNTLSSSGQPSASTSARKQEAVLPHATVDTAPPTIMYWSKTPAQGRIPRGLRAHSATLIRNDVWCFGGCDARGTCFRDVWKFDCDTFTWTKPKVTGDVPPVTRAHTATAALDDLIFVFGGGDGPTYYNDVYVFDTVCLSWSKPLVKGRAPSKRRAHTAFVYNDKILVFGGGNGANALNDMHALDVSDLDDLTWTSLDTYGQVPVARGYHTSNLVGDGSKCIVFGGSDGSECFGDVHVLDLETLTWSGVDLVVDDDDDERDGDGTGPVTQSNGYPRLSHSTTTVGSNLLVFGGHDGVTFSNKVLMFNLVTLQWEHRQTAGVPPSPRGYHATVLHDSRILVFGGFNGQQVFDEIWTLELAGSAYLPQVTNFQVGDVVGDE
ncbi:hypothetical protein ACM66B_003830 [Microbotryomycetes sp. NB124-2]